MGNVLSEAKKQQVLALGRLEWPLRRIEEATGVRRETASRYLRAAGISIRSPGSWGRRLPPPKAAKEVSTDSGGANAAPEMAVVGTRSPQASACEPFRELIELGLSWRRNATAIYQDLVDDHGFSAGYARVKRYVRKLAGEKTPEACGIILTEPGGGSPGRLRRRADGAPGAGRLLPAHAAIRADPRLQPQVRAAPALPLQLPCLGGAAREGL